MADITVVCTNPDTMNLKVSIEFTIYEWKQLLKVTQGNEYTPSLYDLRNSITKAIEAIERREHVTIGKTEKE